MSTFAVTVEIIGKVWPHPNADKLELAKLVGMEFQFCVPKGEYKEDDKVVYFPIDSLLPPELIAKLGLEGRLSGKDKNRVKTIKLRGEISQGIVAKTRDWGMYSSPLGLLGTYFPGTDVTELFGVTKYEPLELNVRDGRLVALPPLVNVYDIEGADRYPDVVDRLMNQTVVVTEKVEGSHFSASYYVEDGSVAICQRRYRIMPDEERLHDWHKLAQDEGVHEALNILVGICGPHIILTIRGEVVGPGVQGNIYGLPKRRLYFFDLEVDGMPVHSAPAIASMKNSGLRVVPILYHGVLADYLDGRTVKDISHGLSILPEITTPHCLREGIVIKPTVEQWDEKIGRLMIKQRDPIYLEETGL